MICQQVDKKRQRPCDSCGSNIDIGTDTGNGNGNGSGIKKRKWNNVDFSGINRMKSRGNSTSNSIIYSG